MFTKIADCQLWMVRGMVETLLTNNPSKPERRQEMLAAIERMIGKTTLGRQKTFDQYTLAEIEQVGNAAAEIMLRNE